MADLAELASAPVTLSEPGPAPAAPDAGTPTDAPATDPGSATTPADATEPGPPQTAAPDSGTESFLDDPSEVPPELQDRYKQMQAAFSKKTMGVAEQRKSLEQMEQFKPLIEAYQRDPVRVLQDLAAQQGMTLSRGQAQQAVQQAQAQPETPAVDWETFEPNTWKELAQPIRQEIRQELLADMRKEFGPVVENVRKMTAKNIEAQLADIDPEWRQHETAMVGLLQKHSTLAEDPSLLYRMAVPPEAVEKRATERAMKAYEDKAKAARVSSTSTVRSATASPQQPKSISEAYELARAQLASGG